MKGADGVYEGTAERSRACDYIVTIAFVFKMAPYGVQGSDSATPSICPHRIKCHECLRMRDLACGFFPMHDFCQKSGDTYRPTACRNWQNRGTPQGRRNQLETHREELLDGFTSKIGSFEFSNRPLAFLAWMTQSLSPEHANPSRVQLLRYVSVNVALRNF